MDLANGIEKKSNGESLERTERFDSLKRIFRASIILWIAITQKIQPYLKISLFESFENEIQS